MLVKKKQKGVNLSSGKNNQSTKKEKHFISFCGWN